MSGCQVNQSHWLFCWPHRDGRSEFLIFQQGMPWEWEWCMMYGQHSSEPDPLEQNSSIFFLSLSLSFIVFNPGSSFQSKWQIPTIIIMCVTNSGKPKENMLIHIPGHCNFDRLSIDCILVCWSPYMTYICLHPIVLLPSFSWYSSVAFNLSFRYLRLRLKIDAISHDKNKLVSVSLGMSTMCQ